MFAQRLKELRKRNGLTQKEFAKQFHISGGTIAMWETGKREPDFDTTVRIADFFDVSLDYLLGRADELQQKQKNAHSQAGSELNESDFQMAAILKDLPAEQKEGLLVFLRAMISKNQSSPVSAPAAKD